MFFMLDAGCWMLDASWMQKKRTWHYAIHSSADSYEYNAPA